MTKDKDRENDIVTQKVKDLVDIAMEILLEIKPLPTENEILQLISYNLATTEMAIESNIFDMNSDNFDIKFRENPADNLEDIIEVWRHFVNCSKNLNKIGVQVMYLSEEAKRSTINNIKILNDFCDDYKFTLKNKDKDVSKLTIKRVI